MSTKADWVEYRALLVGCGSIGRRHAKNLKSLGLHRLAFCDTNVEALRECRKDVEGELFSNYGEALESFGPDLVLV